MPPSPLPPYLQRPPPIRSQQITTTSGSSLSTSLVNALSAPWSLRQVLFPGGGGGAAARGGGGSGGTAEFLPEPPLRPHQLPRRCQSWIPSWPLSAELDSITKPPAFFPSNPGTTMLHPSHSCVPPSQPPPRVSTPTPTSTQSSTLPGRMAGPKVRLKEHLLRTQLAPRKPLRRGHPDIPLLAVTHRSASSSAAHLPATSSGKSVPWAGLEDPDYDHSPGSQSPVRGHKALHSPQEARLSWTGDDRPSPPRTDPGGMGSTRSSLQNRAAYLPQIPAQARRGHPGWAAWSAQETLRQGLTGLG
jgi:hypothetical protein